MADVTLYGTVKAGVEVSRTKHTYTDGENQPIVTTKDRVATEITDFGSRIGFKGHEHLGNNLNAIWQVEQNASVAGTTKVGVLANPSSVWKAASVKSAPVN